MRTARVVRGVARAGLFRGNGGPPAPPRETVRALLTVALSAVFTMSALAAPKVVPQLSATHAGAKAGDLFGVILTFGLTG